MIAIVTYGFYLLLSLGLTVWVARTLRRGGRRFLLDVFGGDEELADSVNQLLVVGFYLINVGYVALALELGRPLADAQEAIEALSTKVGKVALVLGAMHFFNLYVFTRIRRRATLAEAPPPVEPRAQLPRREAVAA